MGRGCQSFEAVDRKSLNCLEETVDRNSKGDPGEGSERKEECWRESFHLLEHINNREQNGDRNMNVKGHSDEVSRKNDKQVIEN